MIERSGKSESTFIREILLGAKKQESQSYNRGYNDAFNKFAIPCSICKKTMIFDLNNNPEATNKIYETFGKYAHTECIEEQKKQQEVEQQRRADVSPVAGGPPSTGTKQRQMAKPQQLHLAGNGRNAVRHSGCGQGAFDIRQRELLRRKGNKDTQIHVQDRRLRFAPCLICRRAGNYKAPGVRRRQARAEFLDLGGRVCPGANPRPKRQTRRGL